MSAPTEELSRLVAIVHRLRAPDGCPWDRAQTHDSIKRNLIEEAGEFLDAVEDHDREEMKEELGDLLLQVLLHAEMEAETGAFDIEAIAKAEADKLVRRHPHVFGNVHAANAAAALDSWDAAKKTEGGVQAKRKSAMEGVPRAMPGLARAQKALTKAARQGFTWPNAQQALEKVKEELKECEDAIACGDASAIREELGDLLFTVVNLCRLQDLEAEELAHFATVKFMRNFARLEEFLAKRNRPMKECTLEELLEAWRQAK